MKLRKVRNENLYYVITDTERLGPFPKHVAQEMYGGNEPEIENSNIDNLIQKEIEKQQYLLRSGSTITGSGSADPTDDTPQIEPIDEQYILDYIAIEQKNQKTQQVITQTIDLLKKIFDLLTTLVDRNTGKVTAENVNARSQYVYSNILMEIANSPLAPRNAKTALENARTKFAFNDPTRYNELYSILNNFSPIPDLKINWYNVIFRKNVFDLQDFISEILSLTYPTNLNAKFPLIPYPTLENTDSSNLTSIYLAERSRFQQLSNLETQKSTIIQKMVRLIRNALYPATSDQMKYGINGVSVNTHTRNLQEEASSGASFNRLQEIFKEFQITDSELDTYLNSLTSLKTQTFDTNDDVEFFKDKRISKYNWTLGDKIQSDINGISESLSNSIPVVGPVVGGLLTNILSPIAAISFASSGNGSDAIVMLSAFAKQFPFVNVIYSVSSILDKLVKKQPITDSDKDLLKSSLQSSAETLATGVSQGLISSVFKKGISAAARQELRAAAFKGIKQSLKDKLIASIYSASAEELDHQAAKIFVTHNIKQDESHISDENPFYFINDIGTSNTYLYYLFPDQPIPEEVQDMVDANVNGSVGETIVIIPPASLFQDAIRKYTPKKGDEFSILFRKLAFQDSDFFQAERQRLQTLSNQYYQTIATQLSQQQDEEERPEYLEYIKDDYFTIDNIKTIRKDGVDETKPTILQLPLIIPKPNESLYLTDLENTLYSNMVQYLQNLVNLEEKYVEDTMTYIKSYSDTIINDAIKELLTKLTAEQAAFSIETYDQIFDVAAKSFAKIIESKEIENSLIKQINEIKAVNGNFFGTFPPITSELTGSGDPSISDYLQNNTLYNLKDLIIQDIQTNIPKLKVTKGTIADIGYIEKYSQEKNLIETRKNIDSLKEQTLTAIDTYYNTILNSIKNNFFNKQGYNLVLAKYWANKGGFLWNVSPQYSSDFVTNLVKFAINNARPILAELETGVTIDDVVNSVTSDPQTNLYDSADFLARVIRAAYLSRGKGWKDNDLWKLILDDKQRLINNITNNPQLTDDGRLTESDSDLQARLNAYNEAWKNINLEQQKTDIFLSTPFNITGNDVRQFIKEKKEKAGTTPGGTDYYNYTYSFDAKGLLDFLKIREEKPDYSNVKFVPKTLADLKYSGPKLTGSTAIPSTYNKFAYIGQEEQEIDAIFDNAYNSYLRTTKTPMSKSDFRVQRVGEWEQGKINEIRSKYEALRSGRITERQLPTRLPKYVPPPELAEEEEPEEEEEEEPEEEEEEEEEEAELTPQEKALYTRTFSNSILSLIPYLYAQQKVDPSSKLSKLIDVFDNFYRIDQDIIDALLELYTYQEDSSNYFTIRHYVHPLLFLLQKLGEESVEDNIQEEDERQVEEMVDKLKKYKYTNSKFTEFIEDGGVSIKDILKKFPDIAKLVKQHPNITDDDLSEIESQITLNKSYVKTQPSNIPPVIIPTYTFTNRGFTTFGR